MRVTYRQFQKTFASSFQQPPKPSVIERNESEVPWKTGWHFGDTDLFAFCISVMNLLQCKPSWSRRVCQAALSCTIKAYFASEADSS